MEAHHLISNSYRDVCLKAHAEGKKPWGADGWKHAASVAKFAKEIGAKTILDYGCGQGRLRMSLEQAQQPYDVFEYDPAIEGKSQLPKPADLVACTDVLEHIEPEKIDNVLEHIWKLANKGVFLVVSTRPANKILPDGRNAHLIVEPATWWLAKFAIADIHGCLEAVTGKEFTYVGMRHPG